MSAMVPAADPAPAPRPLTTGPKRIALIEDDADARMLIRTLFEPRFTVVEYATGTRGLLGVCADRPDLVLLDIGLPDTDGFEVLRLLRADPGLDGLPVVAFTAQADRHDERMFLRAGFDDCIVKPVAELEAMVERVEQLLQA